MNNNQNDPKQLDCSLKCKATADLKKSIQEDLEKEDVSLKDLLDNGNKDTIKASH
jgi:hypothetical protein